METTTEEIDNEVEYDDSNIDFNYPILDDDSHQVENKDLWDAYTIASSHSTYDWIVPYEYSQGLDDIYVALINPLNLLGIHGTNLSPSDDIAKCIVYSIVHIQEGGTP